MMGKGVGVLIGRVVGVAGNQTTVLVGTGVDVGTGVAVGVTGVGVSTMGCTRISAHPASVSSAMKIMISTVILGKDVNIM